MWPTTIRRTALMWTCQLEAEGIGFPSNVRILSATDRVFKQIQTLGDNILHKACYPRFLIGQSSNRFSGATVTRSKIGQALRYIKIPKFERILLLNHAEQHLC